MESSPFGERVILELTPQEAVILDEFLRRYSQTDQLRIEHPSERLALWNLLCTFEKHGDRPLWPQYDDACVHCLPATSRQCLIRFGTSSWASGSGLVKISVD